MTYPMSKEHNKAIDIYRTTSENIVEEDDYEGSASKRGM